MSSIAIKGCLLFVLVPLAAACGAEQPALSAAERDAVVDTVKRIIMDRFDAANQRDAASFTRAYAADPDVQAVSNGQIFPNVESLRAAAESFYRSITAVDSRPSGDIRTTLIGPDAAAAHVPFAFTLRTKSGKELAGEGVYSAVLQKREGAWKIVHSHESELRWDQIVREIFATEK